MECTCGGAFFIDSACSFCLTKMKKKLISRRDELQEELDEIDSTLDDVCWHLENPLCEGGCGENIAHCLCGEI